MSRTPTPRGPGRPRTNPTVALSHAKTEAGPQADDETPTGANEDVAAGPAPVDALSEMMTGLQGSTNSRVTIYRIVKNQPPSYVAECDPASFSLDNLRDQYNGGEFRLYVMKDGRLWKNMRVFVEAPPQRPHVETLATSQMDVLSVIREGFATQAAAMRDLAAPRASGPSLFSGADLPAIITAVTGALVALRPPAPPPPAVVETDIASKSIDMFMQGLQLARELKEGASPEDNSIGGMLRSVLQSPLMAQAVQAAATPPAVSHAKPAPAGQRPALPAPPPPPQPAQQQGSDMNMLHYYYGMLCQKAATGADPVLYAELVLDNVPDETLQTLLTKQPTPLDALIAEYPAAAPHREWFATLIDTLMSAMTEEEVQADDPSAGVQQINGVHTDAAHVLAPVVPGQPS